MPAPRAIPAIGAPRRGSRSGPELQSSSGCRSGHVNRAARPRIPKDGDAGDDIAFTAGKFRAPAIASGRAAWATWKPVPAGSPDHVGSLSCRPEPRRDAVDRQEQRRPGVLLPGAMAPQQLDLLPAHLIEHGQAALEAPVELWEPSGEVAGSHEAPDHICKIGRAHV